MDNTIIKEKPLIKPFIQNTLNSDGAEELSDIFVTGWTVKYKTVQVSVSKHQDYTMKEKPEIKPFLQNTLNPSELERVAGHFTTGWTVKYNTVQTAVSKN